MDEMDVEPTDAELTAIARAEPVMTAELELLGRELVVLRRGNRRAGRRLERARARLATVRRRLAGEGAEPWLLPVEGGGLG